MNACGGCQGLGAHGRYCPHHPNYHPWKILAAQAEDIGDTIGSNNPAIANTAYSLAALIRAAINKPPLLDYKDGYFTDKEQP